MYIFKTKVEINSYGKSFSVYDTFSHSKKNAVNNKKVLIKVIHVRCETNWLGE